MHKTTIPPIRHGSDWHVHPAQAITIPTIRLMLDYRALELGLDTPEGSDLFYRVFAWNRAQKRWLYEISHFCGVLYCNRADHIVLESRRQNQARTRCHRGQETHHHLPWCLNNRGRRFLSDEPEGQQQDPTVTVSTSRISVMRQPEKTFKTFDSFLHQQPCSDPRLKALLRKYWDSDIVFPTRLSDNNLRSIIVPNGARLSPIFIQFISTAVREYFQHHFHQGSQLNPLARSSGVLDPACKQRAVSRSINQAAPLALGLIECLTSACKQTYISEILLILVVYGSFIVVHGSSYILLIYT